MNLSMIALLIAHFSTAIAEPPSRDKHSARREQDVAKFAKLLAKNDIADLPASFSFWRSEGSLEFGTVNATRESTYTAVRVIYPVTGLGDRGHTFIFAEDKRCILHMRDSITPLHWNSGGFVDLTGNGRVEKVAVFPIDGDDEGGPVSGSFRSRLRVWSFPHDSPMLILDAVLSERGRPYVNDSITVRIVYDEKTKVWSISLEEINGKTHGRFYWSAEKQKIVADGLDKERCRMRKLDVPAIGKCMMHPDVAVNRGEGCPVCGMQLPEDWSGDGKGE